MSCDGRAGVLTKSDRKRWRRVAGLRWNLERHDGDASSKWPSSWRVWCGVPG